jgi:DHA2 family methylenomycin A resistance protein-like MFS transporter
LTAALTMTSTLGWRSPLVLGLLAVAVAVGACFVAAEHRADEPMLPPALFTSSAFSGATGVGLLFNFGLYGVLFCITIFLERTLRQSTAVTGMALLPLTAVITLGALFSGRVTNTFGPGHRWPWACREGCSAPACWPPGATTRARWRSPCSARSRAASACACPR